MKTFEGPIKIRIACQRASCKKVDAVGPECLACGNAVIAALDAGSHVSVLLVRTPEPKKAPKKK